MVYEASFLDHIVWRIQPFVFGCFGREEEGLRGNGILGAMVFRSAGMTYFPSPSQCCCCWRYGAQSLLDLSMACLAIAFLVALHAYV